MKPIMIPEKLTRYAYNKAVKAYFDNYGGFSEWSQRFGFIGEGKVAENGVKVAECYRTERPVSIIDIEKVDAFHVIFQPVVTRSGYAPEIKKHWLRINTYAEAVRQNEKLKQNRGVLIGNIGKNEN